MGFCRKCGRLLRNPESIKLGIGPVCLLKELGVKSKFKVTIPPIYLFSKEIMERMLVKEENENDNKSGD